MNYRRMQVPGGRGGMQAGRLRSQQENPQREWLDAEGSPRFILRHLRGGGTDQLPPASPRDGGRKVETTRDTLLTCEASGTP